MRPCFAFSAATEVEATVSIYDEIGFWGVQAKDFSQQISQIKAPVLNVEINSPGGDVFAGIAIFNMLRASGKEIVVKVMGVAASAASLIAMAGDRIVMPKNTFMMIHNPWSFAMGNADELRKTADTLDTIGTALLETYAAKTGLSNDEITSMLATDTWLTADEALEKGFATEVIDPVEAKARFDMDRADLPENVKAMFLAAAKPAVVVPEPIKPVAQAEAVSDQIVAFAKAEGMEEFGACWAVAFASLDEAKARAGEAREIKALCVIANKTELAAPAIKAGKTLAAVRADLIKAMADEDSAKPTDSRRTSASQSDATGGGDAKPGAVTPQSVWDSHRNQSGSKTAK
jgi:ATP-dependent Clp protease protease subunit